MNAETLLHDRYPDAKYLKGEMVGGCIYITFFLNGRVQHEFFWSGKLA
jgi:hypothetical protein